MRAALAAAVMALLMLLLPAAAQAAPELVRVGDFAQPTHVAAPPGDPARLFVVEKAGRVQVLAGGQKALFADFTGVTESAAEERGLLSIAFPADYATTGLFYVFLTARSGAFPGVATGDLVVLEGRRSPGDPDRADPAARRVVFSVPHPDGNDHNGGQLAFGPDGALYASTGDGGGQGDPGDDAQRTDSNLGKILRVDARGSAGPSIWALGLRNPWRFSFDRATGDLVIGDVGWDTNEEVDLAPAGSGAGRDYGWRRCEGLPCSLAGAVPPVLVLPHADGYSGIIGGFVVRDPGLPTLVGRYVFADLAKDTLLSAALGADREPRPEPRLPVSGPSSFGEDACGRIYVASLLGPVARLQDGAPSPCPAGSGGDGAGADTTPCAVRVHVKPRQRIVRRGKRLRVRLTASEACTATLRAKRFRTRRHVALQANVARGVRLQPTRRGLRKLRRARARSERHRVRISVRVAARDGAGNLKVRRVRATVR